LSIFPRLCRDLVTSKVRLIIHSSIKHSTQGKVTTLIVYVDDIVLIGIDDGEIQNLRHNLANEFEIKDLGSLKYFLGIEVAKSKHGIFMSQRKYILDLLKETGMLGCKATDNPV
jgi:hypothetical protein